jgi:hypothetical protein
VWFGERLLPDPSLEITLDSLIGPAYSYVTDSLMVCTGLGGHFATAYADGESSVSFGVASSTDFGVRIAENMMITASLDLVADLNFSILLANNIGRAFNVQPSVSAFIPSSRFAIGLTWRL